MRIFVSIASESLEKNLVPADKIHDLIIKLGHTHTNNWNTAYYANNQKQLIKNKSNERVKNEILKSDLMLADISIPSFGVGYFVSLARIYKVPTIFIYHANYKNNVSTAFMKDLGIDPKLYQYDDLNLEKILIKIFKKSVPKTKRMNFNIDQNYYRFINALAKEQDRTKTDIIQELIAEKISQSKLKI
ncbi:MAG: hypothetical protein WC069_05060 [Candidatus Shapirobacteria bacterium]